jgi:hypothetical protein
MYGSFQTTAALNISAGTITVHYDLYSAPSGSNIFTLVPGMSLALAPALSGVVATDTIVTGNITPAVAATAGTRYVMVATITTSGGILSTIDGFASGGVVVA